MTSQSLSASLEIKDVSKTFAARGSGQPFVALDDVSLSVGPGEFVAIIGASGCGKTTLLKIVDGLVRQDQGTVVIDGADVKGPGPDRAMVFQSAALLPWRDVQGNVELGLEARGVAPRERREIAGEFIRLVGLSGFEAYLPHALSGGMQQRTGLARALALRPRMLLMDEPFGAVDEQTRRLLQDDLLRICQMERQTVVFVTHSMDEACYLADKVVVMGSRPGRVMEILPVRLPRPRGQDVRRSPDFVELHEYVWDRLKTQAAATNGSAAAAAKEGSQQ